MTIPLRPIVWGPEDRRNEGVVAIPDGTGRVGDLVVKADVPVDATTLAPVFVRI